MKVSETKIFLNRWLSEIGPLDIVESKFVSLVGLGYHRLEDLNSLAFDWQCWVYFWCINYIAEFIMVKFWLHMAEKALLTD